MATDVDEQGLERKEACSHQPEMVNKCHSDLIHHKTPDLSSNVMGGEAQKILHTWWLSFDADNLRKKHYFIINTGKDDLNLLFMDWDKKKKYYANSAEKMILPECICMGIRSSAETLECFLF